LIDAAEWDGSDLFIVWPLPLYRFISERLAGILRTERSSGIKLIPASDIPFERGSLATPGRLLDWMPESRARALGDPLGINWTIAPAGPSEKPAKRDGPALTSARHGARAQERRLPLVARMKHIVLLASAPETAPAAVVVKEPTQ
jgi:hypothetical protein